MDKINKKNNSDIQNSNVKNKKEKDLDSTTTTNLALNKLAKTDKKSKGLIDKTIKESPKNSIAEIQITSYEVLKNKCDKLMNHLHQRMQHSIAIEVSKVSELISKSMSRRAMRKIIDKMDALSRKHGFNFYQT